MQVGFESWSAGRFLLLGFGGGLFLLDHERMGYGERIVTHACDLP